MVEKLDDPRAAAHLFAGWKETMIWSALDGIMGEVYTVDGTSAMALCGDFAFFAGEPNRELVEYLTGKSFIIATPQNEAWSQIIESVHGEYARRSERYAIQKEPDVFELPKLRQMAAQLPDGYTLQRIDRQLYEACKAGAWSKDWVSQYPTYAMYEKLGLGIAVLHHGEIVAGASSYFTYREGIEIQIDTRPDHRRKGLATVCGAALILECLNRGLYPSWDAQNLGSVALAEKLGYHFSHAYLIYEIQYYRAGTCPRPVYFSSI